MDAYTWFVAFVLLVCAAGTVGAIVELTPAIRRTWAAFLDRLLGERCDACRERVFPRDEVPHYRDHRRAEAPS